ncbi:hypothetical protein pb186bvf_003453 [Paramecium bursaria]
MSIIESFKLIKEILISQYTIAIKKLVNPTEVFLFQDKMQFQIHKI